MEHIASVIRRLGKLTPARAAQYHKDAKDYFAKARLAEEERDIERAIYMYKAAYERDNSMCEAANNAGCWRFHLGDMKRAAASFKLATDICYEFPVAWLNLAVARECQGYVDLARTAYAVAAAQNESEALRLLNTLQDRI